ncbi:MULTISPECIES: aspartyl protease [Nostocales]|uniref:Aspartyl protease n=3 Tax=Nostocales TaxID=1161 RepID=A0A0C1RAT4_9CYAN|nr:aspartyl protease [Tolypothrix bouteillei]KAF3888332.1 aspartyl protease [Tolypothrix bouteillei VB521301]
MGLGTFGADGELFFELQLVPANGASFVIPALFDTGFTDGWLVINTQDLQALEWSEVLGQVKMRTARGEGRFYIYKGKVIIDGIEVTIPVHVGRDVPETAMGSAWLDIMKLVVNKPEGIFTLEFIESP